MTSDLDATHETPGTQHITWVERAFDRVHQAQRWRIETPRIDLPTQLGWQCLEDDPAAVCAHGVPQPYRERGQRLRVDSAEELTPRHTAAGVRRNLRYHGAPLRLRLDPRQQRGEHAGQRAEPRDQCMLRRRV